MALIPPYLTLDRNAQGFKDLSAKSTVASLKGMGVIKRYFHRLFPRQEGGQFYCNNILATSVHPSSLRDGLAVHLRDNRMGLWQRAIDAEQVTELGWLLYSSRQQDEKRLSDLLSSLTGEKIGARWRLIKTNTSPRRRINEGTSDAPAVRAIHLECSATLAQHAKHKIARLYSSSTTQFPDGTKMRLIPTVSSIISQHSKEKFGLVIAKQEAFTAHLLTGTSWEFSQNLLLDFKPNNATISLRQVIMGIMSSKFPGKPVFHSVDPAWGSDNGVTFTFIPENEAEARMYIAGLVPYIRDTIGPELLRAFSAEAVDRHADSVFDQTTKQIFSTTDVWIQNSLALDEEYNYTEVPNASIDIDTSHQNKTYAYSTTMDNVSISTFRSKVSSATIGKDTKDTLDQDSPDNSSQATITGSTLLSENLMPQNTEGASNIIKLDSVLGGQDLSGITEEESRVQLLEQHLQEMSKEFKASMQQWESRQSTMDKTYHELFSLIQSALRVSSPPPEVALRSADPTVGSQHRTPSGEDNLSTGLDEAGKPPGVAGSGS